MAEIYYNYKYAHRCFRYGDYSAILSLSIMMKNDMEFIASLIKKCNSIEEIKVIIKANSKILNLNYSRLPHFYFEIIIDHRLIILSPKLKILEGEDSEREKFEPYIKYDIDDIREGTLESIECRLLECKSAQEQVEIIEHYLRRPYRRFSKWITKPNKLFLYHTYGEDPKVFEISFD